MKYLIICSFIELVYLDTANGWEFVNTECGYHHFRNTISGESRIYPVAQTYIEAR